LRITMVGSGYVGLVSGACFADFGHVVTCVDEDPEKIATRESGRMPIFEPGRDERSVTARCHCSMFALTSEHACRSPSNGRTCRWRLLREVIQLDACFVGAAAGPSAR